MLQTFDFNNPLYVCMHVANIIQMHILLNTQWNATYVGDISVVQFYNVEG